VEYGEKIFLPPGGMWRNIASMEWNAEKDQWNTEKVVRVNRGMWRKTSRLLDLNMLSVKT